MNNSSVTGLGAGSRILHALAKNWWLLLLRGLAAIAFGVLALAWPGITLWSLVVLYGAYVLVDGVFALIAAITGGSPAPRWWLAIIGLLGIVAGVVAFFLPGLTAITLLLIIGAWAVVSGVFEIIGAIRLRKEIDNEWMLILHGVVSVLFGALVIINPGAGALAIIWMIATYAIVAGVILCALAFRLRKHAH